jgi:hypothetical protein
MHQVKLLLILIVLMAFSSSLFAQGNFNNSLHFTRNGKNYWYGSVNNGFESFTQVPISEIGCTECHGPTDAAGNAYNEQNPYSGPGCGDCHPNSNPQAELSEAQCLGCHSRQNTEKATLKYSDVHTDAEGDTVLVCWDCHTSNDMHGPSGDALNSMLEPGGIEAECENCHDPAEHPAGKDPHGGKLHCTTCHTQTVIACYNCHFESQVQTKIKRHKQPIHDYVILANRDKDNKVYTMTFQSLTNAGDAFVAFAPFYSHTITDAGRGCADCHNNSVVTEYNSTGEIKFATWNSEDSTLSWKKGVVPMPADYTRSFKMDFITYTGDVNNPMSGADKRWESIGKDTWDGHQMFFATPLTKIQMVKIGFDTTLTAIGDRENLEVLSKYSLLQNYPNPFNPSTTIEFMIPKSAEITIKVFDVAGAEVRTIVAGEQYAAGNHQLTFDASGFASGIYFYKLDAPGFTQTRKMFLLR